MEDLAQLSAAVMVLASRRSFRDSIGRLKREVASSSEPFVWASVDLAPIAQSVPEHIKSAWIFVLKKETWSGAHAHPNSVQHMVVLEGRGRSRIAGVAGELHPLGSAKRPDSDWVVIDAGIEHEFYPVDDHMVVVSFHTCESDELIEVSAHGGVRRYEVPG